MVIGWSLELILEYELQPQTFVRISPGEYKYMTTLRGCVIKPV